MEKVILVDANDNVVGTLDKLEAHKAGTLHRAFSILLFNSKGEMLLQKRAHSKYHSGGLWTNTCCSHPSPEETIEEATRRRLKFEMGIDMQPEFVYKFIYKAPLDHNLIEHELDHVFTGVYNGTPAVNPDEVDDWKYVSINELQRDIQENPEQYTVWFREIVRKGDIHQLAPV
jgi:isopentenyl-diphosphate Delta-isomerase